MTIEDAAELQLQQDHVVRLETRPPNIEGKGAITATDLVKNALRMRPERIIIGECRGAETLDMLQAMNTGHEGSMTTLHANTPRDAIARIETMITMSGFELPLKAMRQQIASAVDLIMQANRLQGGPRKITHITEIVGMEQDTIVMQDIYHYAQDGIDEAGRAVRPLRGHRHPPHVHGPPGIGRRAPARQCLPPTRHAGRLTNAAADSCDRTTPFEPPSVDRIMSPLLLPLPCSWPSPPLVAAVAFWLRGEAPKRKVEDRLALLTGAKVGSGGKDSLLKDSGCCRSRSMRRRALVEEFLARFRNLSLLFEQADATLSPSRVLRRLRRLGRAGRRRRRWSRDCIPASCRSIGLLCGLLPLLWLMLRRRRRFKKFGQAIARRAGTDRPGACGPGTAWRPGFNLVAEEMSAPIATEFRRVFEEQNLGIPLDEALRNMTERMPNLDLRVLRHGRRSCSGRRAATWPKFSTRSAT